MILYEDQPEDPVESVVTNEIESTSALVENSSLDHFGMLSEVFLEEALLGSTNYFRSDDWVFDTDATCHCHICQNRNLFISFTASEGRSIKSAGEKLETAVKGHGTAAMLSRTGKGKLVQLTFGDTIYAPGIRRNLISGPRLDEKGYNFVGTERKIFIFLSDWLQVVLVEVKDKIGQLYHIVSNVRSDPGLNEMMIPDDNDTR
uniref:Retrovirus-related Pol polyprotein from transposon TNT 1-94-like beta-barrel domain-containing protein n=1 Tax=Strigamia maritima TaxID=126957 RepID=T1JFD4_STRMM